VRRFKKRGHFYISTYEEHAIAKKNPFTRSGASNRVRDFSDDEIERARDPEKYKPGFWRRVLYWLWP
jgi:hypothetical protein